MNITEKDKQRMVAKLVINDSFGDLFKLHPEIADQFMACAMARLKSAHETMQDPVLKILESTVNNWLRVEK